MDLAGTPRTLRRLTALSMAVASLTLGGCYFPGGSMQSGGASTYESTSHFPVTITIRNTVTQEDIWTTDVPVGQQLVIWFYPNMRPKDVLLPDTMDWDLMPIGVRYGSLNNTVPMPGASSRVVIVTRRKGVEMPVPVPAHTGAPSGEGL